MAENRISNYVVLTVHADTHTSMLKEDIARSLSYYQQINKDIRSCTYVDRYRTLTAIYIICTHV